MKAPDKKWLDAQVMDDDAQNEPSKKLTVSDQLVLIGMRGVKLFHTPDNTGYCATSLDNGGTAIYKVDSTNMRSMMKQRYYKDMRKVPSADAVRNAIGVIDGIAIFEGDEYALDNRVTWNNGDIVYDMSNPLHESVTVSGDGWEISQKNEPMFMRHSHQLPQATPQSGGDMERIFDIVNVHESDKLMTMVHLVSSLIPNIPHPAPSICGEQGSAKSTASKFFKMLIDPSVIDTASMPGNEERMHQMLSHHWYIIFDNVSWIQDWQSDIFCRGITGQATAMRKLYTDDDDIIFKYKMCLGFNGISYLASRADLLDRSFSMQLDPIADDARLSEEEVIHLFSETRGYILGAMFDALSKAIKIYPTIEMTSLPRMADFAKWGCAIAEGLGYTRQDFMTAYYEKIAESNMNAIEANPVAELIMELMAHRDRWDGTPTELWQELLGILSDGSVPKEDVRGMKSVRALGKIHDRIVPNLRRIGIDWVKLDRSSDGRGYRIIKRSVNKQVELSTDNENLCDDHVVCNEHVVCASYLQCQEEDKKERDLIHRSTNDIMTTIDTAIENDKTRPLTREKLSYTKDTDSKLKHAVGKALSKSDTMGAEVALIAECYPESISVKELCVMLEERGESLGMKERYGKWYV